MNSIEKKKKRKKKLLIIIWKQKQKKKTEKVKIIFQGQGTHNQDHLLPLNQLTEFPSDFNWLSNRIINWVTTHYLIDLRVIHSKFSFKLDQEREFIRNFSNIVEKNLDFATVSIFDLFNFYVQSFESFHLSFLTTNLGHWRYWQSKKR